jgi:hypothetical protein
MAENILKWGLILGSAYVLTKAVTKEKVLSDQNVRNTALGGVVGYVGGPKLEDMLRNNKKQAAYVIGGAVVGYFADKLITDGSLKKAVDFAKEKTGFANKPVAQQQ